MLLSAQTDMRKTYVNGAWGVLVSGLVWVIAGLTAQFLGSTQSLILFFFGGMFIHPAAMLLSKLVSKAKPADKNNKLNALALDVTVLLFVGLFIAFKFGQSDLNIFYSIMLLIIGARYLTFTTLYGLKHYWVLGFAFIALGFMGLQYMTLPHATIALIGGGVEIIVAVVLFRTKKIAA